MKRLLPILLLAACASAPPPISAPEPVPVFAPVAGALQIDVKQSLITVTVRRGGAFARIGHDHVVASRNISGQVDLQAKRAQFQFRLDQLTVDEPALRKQAGLDTTPSADAIAGTRTNMLTRVLEAERYPLVQLLAEAHPGGITLHVTLHGVTRALVVPAQIENTNGTLTVTGQFKLKQSDFGITPMSILGGAMTVQDELELAFTIVAHQ